MEGWGRENEMGKERSIVKRQWFVDEDEGYKMCGSKRVMHRK